MDNSTSEQDSNTNHTRSSFTELRIVDRFVKWLVSFLHLTDEEQEDAGIYFGDKRNDK